ncbi:hypothetical protein [Streptomyces sp. HPF1205]|uniref:hypothetical protein n=1 Tax=Streptomyces sp. HPF1205 TaxID=2873262 RepID=UPI001CECFBD5|nr:hypothetical protein [Streptomyces sp. HPF1205]
MEPDRIDRIVSALRTRGIMAHRAEEGVYEFGIRVVIPDGSEALWNADGAAGLDAEVVRDGTLIGYVPHIPGSETFTEEQTVDAIAATRYSEEGLHPPGDLPAHPDPGGPPSQPRPPGPTRPRGPSHPRRPHWPHK